MNKPITKAQLAKRASLVKAIKEADKPLMKRIDYIITTIFKVCKIKKSSWWALEADEDYPDPISWIIQCIKKDYTFSVQWGFIREVPCFYDKDGEITDICNDGIPSRWLTENFEDELIEGRKEYLLYIKAAKKANEDAEAEKKRILKRLTSKEKAVLGLVKKKS